MKPVVGLLALLLAVPVVGPTDAGAQRATTVRRAAPTGGWIGVSVTATQSSDPVRGRSVLAVITDVATGSPAARAGLRPGDRLVRLSGRPATWLNFQRVASNLDAGDRLTFTIERSGATREVTIEAAPRPPGQVVVLPRSVAVRVDSTFQRLDSVAFRVRGIPSPRGNSFVWARTDSGGVLVSRTLTLEPAPAPGDSTSIAIWFGPGAQPGRVTAFGQAGEAVALERIQEGTVPFSRLVWTDSVLPGLRALDDDERAAAMLRSQRARAEMVALERRLGSELGERPRALLPYLVGQNRVAGAELTPLNPELATYFEVDGGLLVLEVIDGTPLAESGLRPGDVVVSAAGRPMRGVDALRDALRRGGSEALELGVVREGQRLRIRLPR